MNEDLSVIPRAPNYGIRRDGTIINIRTGRVRKVSADKAGYASVQLHNNGRMTVKVHRLMAEAFLPNPDGLPQVNHIDENKMNYQLSNLEWCTAKYNSVHSNAKTHKLCKDGDVWEVTNMADFCKENSLSTTRMSMLVNSLIDSYKGYRRA